MDQIFWKPNWGETPDEEFFAKLDEATSQDSWVLDGNYTRSQGITWPKADTVIWLNLPKWLNLYQFHHPSQQ